MKINIDKPICFFDLECTGLNVVTDRIVQICIIKINPDQSREIYNEYLNPGIPIPQEVIAIHGITDEKVKDSMTFEQKADEILDIFKGCDIAGFNSNQYDVPLLMEEFNRCQKRFPEEGAKLLDMSIIFRKKEPRSLAGALKFYANKDIEGAHDARHDVEATIDVFFGQREKYSDIAEMSSEQLHDFCGREGSVDVAGKLKKDDEGNILFAFGKHKDQPVKAHVSYANWMLSSDFPTDTKNILKQVIAEI